MSTRRGVPWRWCVAVLALVLGVAVRAAPSPTLELDHGKVAFTTARTMPVTGWQPLKLPAVSLTLDAMKHHVDPPTVWVRLAFDRDALPGNLLALSAVLIRERYVVYLNGVDIYRSDGDADTGEFGWHRPLYADLPPGLLRSGRNDLVLRVETVDRRPIALSVLRVGVAQAMLSAYNRQTYLDVTGPQIINGILATLSFGLLLCWLARPRERVFASLALVGGVWWFRNLHYYVTAVPFSTEVFWNATTDSLFALLAVTYAFAATFLQIPNYRRMIVAISIGCLVAGISRYVLVTFGRSDTPSFLATIPVVLLTFYVLGKACWQSPKPENILMFLAVLLATIAGYHDFGTAKLIWTGTGFFLQPYGSLMVFMAFGFALGKRVLEALAAVEDVNLNLQAGIAEATHNLEVSEAARRQLEVASAVESERERMMREMHDGIGSSLITALSVAERQHAPASTIATLKRSIADLRIAVDSLEPIDGDVVMLLASLRYRMERDLRDAGVAFVWKVAKSPPLPWLDAIGALHILRILQEAIGNVLIHAGAQRIEVDCSASRHADRDGVLIVLADDGHGFDTTGKGKGRGLSNMNARAEALSAVFTCESALGMGSRVSIWLPLVKR